MRKEDIPENISEGRARSIVFQALLFFGAMHESKGIVSAGHYEGFSTAFLIDKHRGILFPNQLNGLANCVRGQVIALENHKKMFYPDLGDFELGYDIGRRRLTLHVGEKTSARERLEFALSYAVSSMDEAEAKLGTDIFL